MRSAFLARQAYPHPGGKTTKKERSVVTTVSDMEDAILLAEAAHLVCPFRLLELPDVIREPDVRITAAANSHVLMPDLAQKGPDVKVAARA